MSVYAIAGNVRKIRTEKFEETQKKFSERVNISNRTLQNIERGCRIP